MNTAREAHVTPTPLARDAKPSQLPPSVELEHLGTEIIHSPALNRQQENKEHVLPIHEQERERQFSAPTLTDESEEDAWDHTHTLPSFSGARVSGNGSFSPHFESKSESSESDLDSRSLSPASPFSDEEPDNAAELEAEILWQEKHFAMATRAIIDFDLKTLETLLGPEYYFAWLDFARDKHNIRTPRLSFFYDCAIDFIGQYEEKIHYDAQFGHYYRPMFTEEFLKHQGREEELSKIYPGVIDVAMHATTEALIRKYPLYRDYKRALFIYEQKGIWNYTEAVKSIKSQLAAIPLTVPAPSGVLTPKQILDFNKQHDWHVESKLNALIERVNKDIETEINVLHKLKSRIPLSKQKYKERYLLPFIKQFKEQLDVLRLQYEECFKRGNYDLAQLKGSLIIERDRLLLQEPKQLSKEVQAQTLNEYDINANGVYKSKVNSLTRYMVVRLLDSKYSSSTFVNDTFYDQMVDLRKKMGRDAFERIKDNNGKNMLFHAIEHYKICSDADKTKLEPLIQLLQKHGCQMFSQHVFMDCNTRKRASYNVFEYANLHHPVSPRLPNWPLLACAYEYMFTISPFEEEARIRILNYCQLTHKDLTKWYGFYVWFISNALKETRKETVVDISFSLHKGQQYCGDIELIREIADQAFQLTIKKNLTGFFGRSSLRDLLTPLVEKNDKTSGKVQLFAFPGSVVELDVEIRTRENYEREIKQQCETLVRKKMAEEMSQLRAEMRADIARMIVANDRERSRGQSACYGNTASNPGLFPEAQVEANTPTMRLAHLLHTDRFAPPSTMGSPSSGSVSMANTSSLQR